MYGMKLVTTAVMVLLATVSITACSNSNTAADKAQSQSISASGVEVVRGDAIVPKPANLPTDFPIPDGADITHSGDDLGGGKKSAMLIYETDESMDRLGTTYREYVNDKALELDTQIVDRDNLIINGKVEDTYSYSIIGSTLASKPGSSEIIVTWVFN